MINTLKIIFGVLLVWMCFVVISTSLKSNLFEQWHFLGTIPWMGATLWDFYTNVAAIFLWIAYKEKAILLKLIWLLLLVTLGSIASCTYILLQLFKLKPGEGFKEFFAKQNA